MKKIMRHNAAYNVPLESLDVVVVEDSKQMQTIIRSVLGAMRVQRVRTFDSAEKALQAMLSEPPHLIITDWRMEPISGYQLLRSIRHRRMAPLCFVPVLMVTAHGTRPLVEKALRVGAHHVLVKPLAPTALHQRMQWITRDERKFCLEPGKDFFVIEGVAAALAVQSERRQALDQARLHHARNGGVPGLAKQARKQDKQVEPPLDLVEEKPSSRGLGDLVSPKVNLGRENASLKEELARSRTIAERKAAQAGETGRPANKGKSQGASAGNGTGGGPSRSGSDGATHRAEGAPRKSDNTPGNPKARPAGKPASKSGGKPGQPGKTASADILGRVAGSDGPRKPTGTGKRPGQGGQPRRSSGL